MDLYAIELTWFWAICSSLDRRWHHHILVTVHGAARESKLLPHAGKARRSLVGFQATTTLIPPRGAQRCAVLCCAVLYCVDVVFAPPHASMHPSSPSHPIPNCHMRLSFGCHSFAIHTVRYLHQGNVIDHAPPPVGLLARKMTDREGSMVPQLSRGLAIISAVLIAGCLVRYVTVRACVRARDCFFNSGQWIVEVEAGLYLPPAWSRSVASCCSPSTPIQIHPLAPPNLSPSFSHMLTVLMLRLFETARESPR